MAGYLFVHFIGEGKNEEQVYFSISKDGLYWKDLNQGQVVLHSKIGDKGVRDPFVVKDPISGKYYLIATDLCMRNRNEDWESATKRGSKNIIVWESDNLIDWSEPRACKVGVEKAGCVWAPEAIYDEKRKAFFVFWASYIKEEGEEEGKHRIYGSYTKDFIEFTPAEKYIERERGIIDTTIIYEDGIFYRFSKDELKACIIAEYGRDLIEDEFMVIKNKELNDLKGLEGPQCYQLPNGKWCLIVDQFAASKGYLPMIIEDLKNAKVRVLSENEYHFGITKKRHGGVIKISNEEYKALENRWGDS